MHVVTWGPPDKRTAGVTTYTKRNVLTYLVFLHHRPIFNPFLLFLQDMFLCAFWDYGFLKMLYNIICFRQYGFVNACKDDQFAKALCCIGLIGKRMALLQWEFLLENPVYSSVHMSSGINGIHMVCFLKTMGSFVMHQTISICIRWQMKKIYVKTQCRFSIFPEPFFICN